MIKWALWSNDFNDIWVHPTVHLQGDSINDPHQFAAFGWNILAVRDSADFHRNIKEIDQVLSEYEVININVLVCKSGKKIWGPPCSIISHAIDIVVALFF